MKEYKIKCSRGLFGNVLFTKIFENSINIIKVKEETPIKAKNKASEVMPGYHFYEIIDVKTL